MFCRDCPHFLPIDRSIDFQLEQQWRESACGALCRVQWCCRGHKWRFGYLLDHIVSHSLRAVTVSAYTGCFANITGVTRPSQPQRYNKLVNNVVGIFIFFLVWTLVVSTAVQVIWRSLWPCLYGNTSNYPLSRGECRRFPCVAFLIMDMGVSERNYRCAFQTPQACPRHAQVEPCRVVR